MTIRYITIPGKRIVKAIGTPQTKYAEGLSQETIDFVIARGVNPDKLKIPILVGVSKRHPNDENDETIGKQIARDRLLVKYNKQIDRVHSLVRNVLNDAMITSDRKIHTACKKISNAKERLDKIK